MVHISKQQKDGKSQLHEEYSPGFNEQKKFSFLKVFCIMGKFLSCKAVKLFDLIRGWPSGVVQDGFIASLHHLVNISGA